MRINNIFSNLFLALASVVLTFVFVELAANYYLWNIATEEQFNYYASVNQFKDRYGQDYLVTTDGEEGGGRSKFAPHPYLGYVGVPNWYREEKGDLHNSFGFRGEEVTREKPDGVYRIIAMGSSTTYGTSVRYDESYPYVLQQYLNTNGYGNVEVLNMGVPAYTSYESLMNLQFRALDFEPDLIIVYQGSNDIHARLIWPPEAYVSDNTGFRAPQVQNVKMPEIWEYSTLLRIIGIELGQIESHSSLEWTNWQRAETVVGDEYRSQYNNDTYPSGIFEEFSITDVLDANPPTYFERNTRNMISIAQNDDIDMMFVTYAVGQKINWANVNSPAYARGLDEHNEITRQIAEETASYLFDLAPIFPGGNKMFSDGRHMTAEGNQLRAQLIGDYIIENILRP